MAARTRPRNPGEIEMKTMTTAAIRAVTLGLLMAAPTFAASADPFTWDLSKASPSLAGGTITADTVMMTDYLVNGGPCPPSICASPIAPGEGYDQFIMRINGFSLNGAPVPLAGPLEQNPITLARNQLL
jgi:hypothetical protein